MNNNLNRIFSVFHKFLKSKIRILKRLHSGLKWYLLQRKDKRIAKTRWGYSKFPRDLPIIPIPESYKLIPEIELDYYHYNPSILFQSQDLIICWRVSNYKGSPDLNWAKEELSGIGFNPNQFRNSIAIGKITNFKISNRPRIENQRLLGEMSGFFRINSVDVSDHQNNRVSALIDPKFLGDHSSLILGNFESWTKSSRGKYSVEQSMGVMDIKNPNAKWIIPYQESSNEKNWSYIATTINSFKFLRSSSPQIVLTVSKNYPYLVENIEKIDSNKVFVNGGSNFILVDGKYYLRIARYRFSAIGKYQCHISTVIKHDLNLNEVARTRPFIFRKFGYEICNGFQVQNDEFIFSWGENDESMYLGSMEKSFFLNWLEHMWERS